MGTGPVRRLTVLAAVLAMLGAACTTSRGSAKTSDSSGSSGSSATSSRWSTSSRGVTADTIKIGLAYPDLASLAAMGVLKVDWGPVDQVAQVLVDDVNNRGGINGRKLQLFIAKYSPVEDSEQLAACTKLTEDDQVFAVFNGLLFDNQLCITQQHATILISGGATEQQLGQARAPWIIWQATETRTLQALVELMKTNGALDGHKAAVYAQGSVNKPLVDTAVKALKDAGHPATDTGIVDTAASDIQAQAAQDKVFAQRFQNEKVDTVITVGGYTPAKNWDTDGFHPAIYEDQLGNLQAAANTNPLGKFPVVAGVAATALPDTDLPSFQRCAAVWKQATGKTIETPDQETASGKSTGNTAVQLMCTSLDVFDAAAKAAGKDLNQATFAKGVESIGKISLPYSPEASFGPGKLDGQDSFVLMKWDPTWVKGDTKPQFLQLGQPIVMR